MSSGPPGRPDPSTGHAEQVLEERNRAFRVLYDTVIELAASRPEDVVRTLCRNLRRMSRASCAGLATYDPETRQLRLEAIDSATEPAPCSGAIGSVAVLSPEVIERLCASPILRCGEGDSDLLDHFPQCTPAAQRCSVTGTRYRVACRRDDRLIAVGAIVLPPGEKLKPRDLVETYLDLAGMTIQRQQMISALEASERKFRTLVEGASLGIAILREGRVVYLNPHLSVVTGNPVGATGAHCLRFVDSADRSRLRSLLRETDPARRIPDGYALRLRHATGRAVEVEVGGEPIQYQGRAAFLLFVHDVTERNRMQAELSRAAKLEAIGILAAGIAHEINTPLQYVGDNICFLQSAFSDLGRMVEACRQLSRGSGPGSEPPPGSLCRLAQEIDFESLAQDMPGALGEILEGLEHVREIVKAMKVLATPSTDGFIAANLNNIVTDCVTVTHSRWRPVADLQTDLEPGLPEVICQPGAVQQAVLNLLINAVQAIEAAHGADSAPGGRIEIRTRRAGSQALIEVSDTGDGIAPEDAPRIFDPFFTTRPVGTGRGQGLTLAHSIVVDRHGGSLTFEPRPERGTTFRVALPFEPPAVVYDIRPARVKDGLRTAAAPTSPGSRRRAS